VSRGAVERRALLRLDAGEVLRSRWPLVLLSLYAALAAIFTFGALRESNVLGFTGAGRLLISFTHALLMLLPLLAIAATGTTLNRARENGTLELLLGHPVTPAGFYDAVTLVRLGLLLLPLVVLLVLLPFGTSALFGGAVPWSTIARTLVVATALTWAFVGIGMALSAYVGDTARAAILGLLAWAAAVALLDFALIGILLEWRLEPLALFVVAAANPVQSARMALLSGLDPELGTYGPLGFFLAQRIGSTGLFLVGAGWPALLGTLAWLAGRRRFRDGDLV